MTALTTAITAAIQTELAGSLTGVVIKDLDDIPEAVDIRECPVLFPDPRDGFITNLRMTPDSTGGEGARAWTVVHQLRYTLAFAPMGAERGLMEVLPDCYDLAKQIVEAVAANDTLGGAVLDFTVASIVGNGQVADAAGNMFYGFTYLFEVTEFI